MVDAVQVPDTPVVTTPPAVDEASNFDAMFAELAREEAEALAPPKTKEPAKVQAEPTPAPEPAPEPETAAEPAAETRAETKPEPEPAPKRNDDDLLTRFAEIVHAKGPQQQPQQQPRGEPEYFSPQEKSFLEQYQKDWPDVARAESIRRRAEYNQIVGYVFSEVANTIRPLMSQLQTLAERTQLADLYAVEPEYNTLRDRVVEWIDTQPAYLKPAYEYVRDQGTAEQVADLISRYKRESGSSTQTQSAPARVEEPLPAATKRAAAALAPVGSKRSVVVQQDDPNDFDAAFQAFSKL